MKLEIDFDSTIANFIPNWLQWLYDNELSNKLHTTREVLSYDWMFKEFGDEAVNFFNEDPFKCYETVKPYEGAKEFLTWCCDNYDTEILTHSWKKETEQAKTKWVQDHIGIDIKLNFCYDLEDKYKKLSKDDLLIDDYPHHVLSHNIYNNGYGIIFDFNEENGWSKIEDYKEIDDTMFDERKCGYATNYDEVMYLIQRFHN